MTNIIHYPYTPSARKIDTSGKQIMPSARERKRELNFSLFYINIYPKLNGARGLSREGGPARRFSFASPNTNKAGGGNAAADDMKHHRA